MAIGDFFQHELPARACLLPQPGAGQIAVASVPLRHELDDQLIVQLMDGVEARFYRLQDRMFWPDDLVALAGRLLQGKDEGLGAPIDASHLASKVIKTHLMPDVFPVGQGRRCIFAYRVGGHHHPIDTELALSHSSGRPASWQAPSFQQHSNR